MMESRYPDASDANRAVHNAYLRFAPNGSGTIDQTKNIGIALTPARTDVGKFTVTTSFRAFRILHVNVQTWDVALAAHVYDVLDAVQQADGTFVITIQQADMAGSAVELAAANAKTWISVQVVAQLVNP